MPKDTGLPETDAQFDFSRMRRRRALSRDFDRRSLPTRGRVRSRWERIPPATRRGEEIPPIDVYRIGELHFVKDGHHRVSVARALGFKVIDAYVTEVLTEVGADRTITLRDLPLKSHQRLFHE